MTFIITPPPPLFKQKTKLNLTKTFSRNTIILLCSHLLEVSRKTVSRDFFFPIQATFSIWIPIKRNNDALHKAREPLKLGLITFCSHHLMPLIVQRTAVNAVVCPTAAASREKWNQMSPVHVFLTVVSPSHIQTLVIMQLIKYNGFETLLCSANRFRNAKVTAGRRGTDHRLNLTSSASWAGCEVHSGTEQLNAFRGGYNIALEFYCGK